MRLTQLRNELRDFLGFEVPSAPDVEMDEPEPEQGYDRRAIRYRSPDGDAISAYLLTPSPGGGSLPGVVVHHQHHSEHWLGKSEPAGVAGDPLQGFGPALARRGVVVLAPDSIGFEERRVHAQYQNELTYRLVSGDTLMRKVLADSALAVSVLRTLPRVCAGRVGMLGHSYGGNTVLFHAPLDERVRFACASGAAASYRARMAAGTGIELAQAIPGFLERFEVHDLVACMAPRPLLLLSATADPYSADADDVERTARPFYESHGGRLEHSRFEGGHALTPERTELITSWIAEKAAAS
jgi:dienelactone hydrolase